MLSLKTGKKSKDIESNSEILKESIIKIGVFKSYLIIPNKLVYYKQNEDNTIREFRDFPECKLYIMKKLKLTKDGMTIKINVTERDPECLNDTKDELPGVIITKNELYDMTKEYLKAGYKVKGMVDKVRIRAYKPSFISNKVCFMMLTTSYKEAKLLEKEFDALFCFLRKDIRPALVIQYKEEDMTYEEGDKPRIIRTHKKSDVPSYSIEITKPSEVKLYPDEECLHYTISNTLGSGSRWNMKERLIKTYRKAYPKKGPTLYIISGL